MKHESTTASQKLKKPMNYNTQLSSILKTMQTFDSTSSALHGELQQKMEKSQMTK